MTVHVSPTPQLGINDELLARWRQIPVAVTVDLSSTIRQIDPVIRPLRMPGTQPALFGRAVTAACEPPDFGGVLYAMDILEAGDVLMIAASSVPTHAMIGDVLGGLSRNKSVAGVVCDGAIRDVAEIAAWEDFPVYTRSVTPRGPTGFTKGSVNQPVSLGNATVNPGDLVLGDDDGVIVLSAEDAANYIDSAEARLVTEEDWRARLYSGEPVNSVFSLS